MEYDWEAIDFGGDLMNVVENEHNASLDFEEGGKIFEANLFEEYKAAGKPKKRKQWIRERIKDEFKSLDKPPRWIEKEPAWAYLNGKPMVFICQYTLPKTEITSTLLAYDREIYVFGSRAPRPDGLAEVVYRVIEQLRGF